MREYAARSSTTYAFNVVRFPEASSMLQDVKTLSGSPLSGSTKASMIPVLTGEALIGDALMTFPKLRVCCRMSRHYLVLHQVVAPKLDDSGPNR